MQDFFTLILARRESVTPPHFCAFWRHFFKGSFAESLLYIGINRGDLDRGRIERISSPKQVKNRHQQRV